VTLSWTAVAGAATYNVYRSTISGGEGGNLVLTGIKTSSFTDIALADGTTYFYEVTAVTSGGESARSAEASATTNIGLAASYSGTPPLFWQAGQTMSYTLTVTNTGAITWLAQGPDMFDLGVYFTGTGDAPGQWTTEPMRAFLSSDLAPGASETITVTATAPSAPGVYVLRPAHCRGRRHLV